MDSHRSTATEFYFTTTYVDEFHMRVDEGGAEDGISAEHLDDHKGSVPNLVKIRL